MTMSAARIVAVNWVALTNVVVRAAPLIRTAEPTTKFVPFTVSAKSNPPAETLTGASPPIGVVIVGTGTVETVKLIGLDVPPPGNGLKTVTGKFPTAAISLARICAVNWVALTNAVVRAAPLKWTTELLSKFMPLTVNVNAGSPAVLLVADKVLIAGTGWLTVKICGCIDVPPPGMGLVTVTEIKVPPTLTSDAVIVVVNCPELTMVAG